MNAFTVQDPLFEYLKLKYPDSCMCVIKLQVHGLPEFDDFSELCKKYGVDYSEEAILTNLLIVQGTLHEVMELCNSLHDGIYYAYVIENGEIVHENT